jgi:hypothetical protein
MRDDPLLAREETEAVHEGGGLRLSASVEDEEKDESHHESAPLPSGQARGRLASALLFKGAFDLLFVLALAGATFYSAFKPTFRGALERADARTVEGWVFDRTAPDRAVEVQLYVDGELVANGRADRSRPEVRAAGLAPHERVGFLFLLDPPVKGHAVARVYAVGHGAGGTRLTLEEVGAPLGIGAR